MRILHVISSLSDKFGGPVSGLKELLEALSSRGHESRVITTDYLGENGIDLPASNAQITILKAQKFIARGYAYGRGFKNIFYSGIKSADIVHIHGLWQYTTLLAARLCQNEGKPYVITPCGMLDPWSFKQKWAKKALYYLLFEKKNLLKASLVQFKTEEERRKSRVFIGNANTKVLPLGVSRRYAVIQKPSDEKLPFALDNRRYVLFLGRLHPKKGLRLLLRAFSEFSKKRKDIYLVLAGEGERAYVKKLKRVLCKLGLEKRVIFLGHISGALKLGILRGAEMNCVLSKQENFGCTIVESLHSGVPVIVSRAVDLAVAIENASCGFVCADARKDIASCMEKLINSEDLRKDMGERGRIWVKECFTWDRLIPEYEEMYHKALGVKKC